MQVRSNVTLAATTRTFPRLMLAHAPQDQTAPDHQCRDQVDNLEYRSQFYSGWLSCFI